MSLAREYLALRGQSIEQARLVLPLHPRPSLRPGGGYSVHRLDSTRISITHRASNTRLRVLSSQWEDSDGDRQLSSPRGG